MHACDIADYIFFFESARNTKNGISTTLIIRGETAHLIFCTRSTTCFFRRGFKVYNNSLSSESDYLTPTRPNRRIMIDGSLLGAPVPRPFSLSPPPSTLSPSRILSLFRASIRSITTRARRISGRCDHGKRSISSIMETSPRTPPDSSRS